MLAVPCVVEVRLRDEPDHANKDLQMVSDLECNYDCGQLTPVKMNSVAINGLHLFG